jgi:hypothetical protein
VRTRHFRMLMPFCLCMLTIVFVFALSVDSDAQQTVPTTKTYIKLGEDFLHALYPVLSDKKYTITVETSFRNDDPTDIPTVFTLDVGTGPKSFVIACCFGGAMTRALIASSRGGPHDEPLKISFLLGKSGAPGGIRTPDLLVRSHRKNW